LLQPWQGLEDHLLAYLQHMIHSSEDDRSSIVTIKH
jgi:hypothetical protein